MTKKDQYLNQTANESISKFKLLTAYGGAGSIVHTRYGSIIVSCIEEWGFLKRIQEIRKEGINQGKTDKELNEYVISQAKEGRNGNIQISNDERLLRSLSDRKELPNLNYLVLIPDIELKNYNNKVKENVDLTIPSTFMPKLFRNKKKEYKPYSKWYDEWTSNKKIDDRHGNNFFPPKFIFNDEKGWYGDLIQDNIVLICEHGHISDFPWSKYLAWKTNTSRSFNNKETIDLFNHPRCCGNDNSPTSEIKITSSTANASGFDGKWLSCSKCGKQTSLQGLMSLKIKCPGHLPWEVYTGENKYYSGSKQARSKSPKIERGGCKNKDPMKAALTTGNNLYFSRVLSSIYMPDELTLDDRTLKLKQLELEKEKAIKESRLEDAILFRDKLKALEIDKADELELQLEDSEKEVHYRYQEFNAFSTKSEEDINFSKDHLKVRNVTSNLNLKLSPYFKRILRIDNMKITSAQLDFSRVMPADADSTNTVSKNIFRSQKADVEVYPVVESFGEGIFFAFDEDYLEDFLVSDSGRLMIEELNEKLEGINSDSFSRISIEFGRTHNWQLYLIHSFSHLIMKELEFRCGYPTASLSERIYVSNNKDTLMYGVMIYTAEGAEGSMGGLIAQTTKRNLNALVENALSRATICQSDPLCWESEGQGLFDLNFSSCFSCSLVSETSCEHRNMYLDRRILVDETNGFFKEVMHR